MSSPGDSSASTGDAQAPPVRILLPSQLGVLGIEILGEQLTRVVVVPKGRERKTFTPLADWKPGERSEFVDEALGRFSEFLAGARRHIDLAYDLRAIGVTGFERRVLRETAKIPYGRTRTYQQIGYAAGRPDAYRQVLSVLGSNPLPLAIPCHRVVTFKSGVGSWIGGTKKKAWLLKMEEKHRPLL